MDEHVIRRPMLSSTTDGQALLFWYTIAMIIGFVFIMAVKPLS
jgi:hypothetical protein